MSDFRRTITQLQITGDFLATRPSEQASNLRWLRETLTPPFESILGNETSFAFGAPAGFDQSEFLRMVSATGNAGDIHRWFDGGAINAQARNFLKQAIAPGTLIIGYELSENTRKAFDSCAIAWIDIWLHPVRFAKDVIFAFRASDATVKARLLEHGFSDAFLFDEAKKIRQQTRDGSGYHAQNLIAGAFLFAGQLPRDKSLLRDGRFQTLEDHKATLADLSSRLPHIYYLDHPKLGRTDQRTNHFLAGFSNISRMHASTYALLADPRISGVAALSSSVCEEARYFEKQSFRFLSPTIPLTGDAAYVGIYQKIGSAPFWRDILSDLVQVNRNVTSQFNNANENLRDKLGFHWSEKQLPGRDTDASVVTTCSFDLFDTLITRRYSRPDQVFDAIADRVAPLLGVAPENFRAARQNAELLARQWALAEGREEPGIREIYAAMEPTPSETAITTLVDIEFNEELDSVVALPAGRRAFINAQTSKTTPVVISDTYYSADACACLLKRAGFPENIQIFTSADHGKTKKSGGLFQLVLEHLNAIPDKHRHVGDNLESDIFRAQSLCIQAEHMPLLRDNLQQDFPTLGPVINRLEYSSLSSGLLLKSAALAIAEDAQSASRAWRFGALCLGPLLTGYALWLHDRARENGVERLGFLSREGAVMRRCFDTLFPNFETFDVVASRQMAMRAAAVDFNRFSALASRVAAGETLGEWCQRVAGFVPDEAVLTSCSISGPDDVIGKDCSRQAAMSLVNQIADAAITSNRSLATNYLAYLTDLKLDVAHSAIVDIGYKGSMQSAMSSLLCREVKGFYLAASASACEGHARGYLTEVFDTRGKSQIERNRCVYEALLCEAGSTYVGVLHEHGKWVGQRSMQDDCPARMKFVVRAHDGAAKMASKFSQIVPDLSGMEIAPDIANLAMSALLANPDADTARVVGLLGFDDASAEVGFVPLADPRRSSQPIWQEGAKALKSLTFWQLKKQKNRRGPRWAWRGNYGFLGWRHLMTPIVAIAIARIGQPHDVDHYRDDPVGFFRRLSSPKYRRIGRWLYPKD